MKYLKCKFLHVLCLFCVFCAPVAAQDQVNVEISDGITNASLKQRIETQLSRLLTAINTAESKKGDINFSGINISDMASQSLTSLWANARFRCVDDDIVEHGLQQKTGGRISGYQIRNIIVEMKPTDEAYTDDLNQEINVDFDLNGKIIDFNVSIDKQQYVRILRDGFEVDDIDERMVIVATCEKLESAYCSKDIKRIDDFFSDDALIVTGRVITRKVGERGLLQTDVVFEGKTKEQYLKNLRRLFNDPKTGAVNVKFSEIKIKRHGAKPNYYAVTLEQDWHTDAYSDKGIVILLFDFENRDEPKIEVRTWQPMGTDVNKGFQYIDSIKRR